AAGAEVDPPAAAPSATPPGSGSALSGPDAATADSAPPTQPAQGSATGKASAHVRAELAGLALESILRGQIADGKLEVQRQDGKVHVVLGAGGSFRSGSADLSSEAVQIMEQIARTSDSPGRTILVTGHTDDVPLSGGPHVDNFGLAAARASSVVRALVASGKVDPARISAASKGEFAPVADNRTEEGRARNRRIEILIDYGD
ncbi:MAG: flagellar motor protein MotB, partial [Gemmobacter sp.]|nr:flagellar motor protein MotB [Gemmobacter sp.]